MTRCTLCELPTGHDPVLGADGDEPFCCRGCRAVHAELGEPPETAAATHRRSSASGPADGTAPCTDESETAYLAVDGMHCTTCEAFLASIGDRIEGVCDVDASYATGAVRVRYDPDVVDRSTLPAAFSRWGYEARERTAAGDARGGGDYAATDASDAAGRLLVGVGFGMMAMLWYALFLYPTYLGLGPVVELGPAARTYLFLQLWVFATVVLGYTGRPLLRGALVSLRTRRPNVDLLVSLAAVAAYCYSVGVVLTGGTHLYFDVTIVIVVAVTVGTHYERRLRARAASGLADLADLRVEAATLAATGESVPIEDVSPGDALRVRAGERIPVDGTVVDGRGVVDRSLLTGEARPAGVEPGDGVQGGTVLQDGQLTVRADAGAESTLDRLVDLLWDVQSSRPGPQRLADRLATLFVPLVLVLAAATVAWLVVAGTPLRTATLAGLAVVVVSCPCALGLATPLAVAAGLTAAVDRGVLIATAALFETGADVDAVLLDKTGTLTDGRMAVQAVVAPGADAETVRRRASAVESLSTHPVAAAVADAGPGDGSDVADFERHARGVSGRVDGARVVVGHPATLHEQDLALSPALETAAADAREAGAVPVVVGWDGRARGCLVVDDSPRDDWAATVERLGEDTRVVVLTGDDAGATARFEAHPAVDDVYAGVPPDGKAATVRRLAADGTVAMVGDGSNDAPALAEADVGIALADGTQLAGDAADAVVGDVAAVPSVFAIADATRRRIRGNLAWAFCYNAVAIPLAVAGLVNPLLAAVAMAASSLLVVANSARPIDAGWA